MSGCARCGVTMPSGRRFDGMCPGCLARLATGPDDASPISAGGLEIVRVLGQGGMGTVYAARQTELDRPVALKVLHPRLGDDPAFLERFRREAKTLAALDHPNIVRIIDFSAADDRAYLVMEHVDGQSLRERMRRSQIPPEEAWEILAQVCRALAHAHDRGIVHRDIKPENILIDASGRVKIADFGLAKLAADSGPGVTRTNVLLGTPQYMAPEQFEGRREIDRRADIYSLGVVLYEMLTGEVPMGSFDPPSRRVAVSPRIDRTVLKALSRDPGLRYPDVRQFHREIQAALRPRRRILPWGAATLVVLLAGWGIWSLTRPTATVGSPSARGDAFTLPFDRLLKAKSISLVFSGEGRTGKLLVGENNELSLRMNGEGPDEGLEIVSDGKTLAGRRSAGSKWFRRPAPPWLRKTVLLGFSHVGAIEFFTRLGPEGLAKARPEFRRSAAPPDSDLLRFHVTAEWIPGEPVEYTVALRLSSDNLPIERKVVRKKGDVNVTLVEKYSSIRLNEPVDPTLFRIPE